MRTSVLAVLLALLLVACDSTLPAGGTLASLLSTVARGEMSPPLWVLHGILVLVTLGVIGLSWWDDGPLAAHLLTSTCFVVVALATSPWLNGATSFTTHVLSVLVAGLLLGEVAVLLVGTGALLTTTAVGFSQAAPWTDRMTSSLVIVLVATGLIWLTMRTLARALARVQRGRGDAGAAGGIRGPAGSPRNDASGVAGNLCAADGVADCRT